MMYAHLLEPPPKLSERRPDLGFPVDEVIAKAVAKSRDDRYARPSEFALALRQAVGANAPVGPETILAGSALAAPAARPLRPLRPRSRPSRSRGRRSQSRRRNRRPRRPQGLRTAASSSSAGAFSRSSSQPASSFLCWRSPAGSPRHPRRLRPGRRAPSRQARRPSRPRRRACCQSWRRRRSRRSAQRKARRPTGQWRPSSACRRRPIRHPCPTRSDSRSIPGHRPSSGHTGGSTPGLAAPATRWSNADPPRRANVPGSTRPGSGAVGSSATRMRRGTSSSSGPTRSSGARITWTCSAPRPSPAARRRSSAAGGIRSTTRSASAVRRSARSFASPLSLGSRGPRDRLRRWGVRIRPG